MAASLRPLSSSASNASAASTLVHDNEDASPTRPLSAFASLSSISSMGSTDFSRAKPPSHSQGAKNLVLCLDGTTNSWTHSVTNIPQLYGLLSQNPAAQLTYYQSGIGTTISTFNSPWMLSILWHKLSQVVDSGVAWSLEEHVSRAYTFLMNYYTPGDRIFLFGFSRGAFTARALAGILQQVGLLPPGNEESIPLAYSIYSRTPEHRPGSRENNLAAGFKRTFSREVQVHFIGVWDTVASVGAIRQRILPFARGSSTVGHFRQALALDECRSRYLPQLWMGQKADDPGGIPNRTVKEVWFAGSHAGVGGGEYPNDGTAPSLSNLSLRWMVREAVEQGLQLDNERVAEHPAFAPFYKQAEELLASHPEMSVAELFSNHPDAALQKFVAGPPTCSAGLRLAIYLSSKPSPQSTADACAPRVDHLGFSFENLLPFQLKDLNWKQRLRLIWRKSKARCGAWMWSLLEVYPQVGRREEKHKVAPTKFGRGRSLPSSPLFHFSVRSRLEAQPNAFPDPSPHVMSANDRSGYRINASFRAGERLENVVWEE